MDACNDLALPEYQDQNGVTKVTQNDRSASIGLSARADRKYVFTSTWLAWMHSAAEALPLNGLRLDIEAPLHGWVTVRLTAPTVAVEFVASFTPHDSISALARAAAEVASGSLEEVVAWNTEPIEYDFRFRTTGRMTRLQVEKYPNHRRGRGCSGVPVAEVAGETAAVVLAVWRGLRRLRGAMTTEAYAAAWRHPFPDAVVDRLGDLVR